MKKRYWLPVSALLLAGRADAQIPNGGFERWTQSIPNDWAVLVTPTGVSPVTKDSLQQHSGAAAARGTVLPPAGLSQPFPYPPILLTEFPYASRPAALTGYLRYALAADDSVVITVLLSDSANGIGGGAIVRGGTQGNYAPFSIPIEYASPDQVRRVEIAMTIVNDTAVHPGSYFLLDELAFSGTNDVAEERTTPSGFALLQNYPNPFNPSTTISYVLSEGADVRLSVFDGLGREVARLVDGREEAGPHRAEFAPLGLASGVYFARLQAGAAVRTMKMAYVR